MGNQTSGRATSKQRRLLVELGHVGNADSLTKADASQLIEELAEQRKATIEDAKRIASSINLVSVAEKHTKLSKIAAREYAGPCPHCAGTDRFHVTGQWFFCRQCHADRGDAIELSMFLYKTDFVTACQQLVGGNAPLLMATATTTPLQPTARTEQPATWLQSATRKLVAAQSRLVDDDAGVVGRAYLMERSLHPATWATYGLGLADAGLPGTWDETRMEHVYPPQPAIVMPWFANGGKRLIGSRYRFLQSHTYTGADGREQTAKQSALYGSDFTKRLFGGQALPEFVFMPATDPSAERGRSLLICEGEINAMSIYQVGQDSRLDVMSIGSESATLPGGFVAWAGRYGQILTWLDDKALAAKAALALPGAHAIDSLSMGKRDANDLLREGLLGAFLATVRFQLCQSKAERQTLYWVLSDDPNPDAGTTQVLARMAEGAGG